MAFFPRKKPTENPPKGTFKLKCPVSPTEERLFTALLEAASSSYFVFPKMALQEVITNTHNDDFLRISSKTVDFMIYEKQGYIPKCAIELDDDTHNDSITKAHDAVKEYFLNTAGIPLLRIKPYPKFLPKKIRDLIMNAKVIENMEYPIPPITVEVEPV